MNGWAVLGIVVGAWCAVSVVVGLVVARAIRRHKRQPIEDVLQAHDR